MSYSAIIAAATLNWNGDADENGVGDPNDNTANGNNGTWTGTATYGTALYGSGKTFDLNGSSYVTAAVPTVGSDRSVAVWFKSSDSGADRNIIELGTTSSNKITARLNSGALKCVVDSTATSSGSGLADGNWHHVAIVVEVGVATRFYLDGALVQTMAEPGVFSSPTLYAGDGSGGSPITGELYDVIYNETTAWSATDVGDLYAEGTAPADTTPPTLIASVIPADGLTITIVFDETIQNSTGFSLTAPSAVTLSNPVVDANTITYDLSRTIGYTESIVLDYAPGNVQDSAGNALASITDRLVTNQSLVGASLTGGGSNSGIKTGGQL